MPTDADLRVGLVGAGWAAREHAESLAAIGGTSVTGIYDASPDTARDLAGGLDARVYESVDQVLESARPDALIVATPAGAHQEAVAPALEQGIPTFVEKPLARSVSGARAIVEAADRSGTLCAVGYQWRALDTLPDLTERLSDQEIALLISVGIGITQARGWYGDDRLSGGLMFERVSHHIDLQRLIAGEVAMVSAQRGSVPLSGLETRREPRDDVLSLSLAFARGAIGAVHVGWVSEGYPGTQSLTLHATSDAYDIDLDPVFSIRSQRSPDSLLRVSEHPFRAQLRRFLRAIRSGDPAHVACSAREALGTVEVAAAAETAIDGAPGVLPVLAGHHDSDGD